MQTRKRKRDKAGADNTTVQVIMGGLSRMSVEAPAEPPGTAEFGIAVDMGTTYMAASVSHNGKRTTFDNFEVDPEPNRINTEVPTTLAYHR
ncbi:hypothetical protein SLS61_005141 [Didymella pomorum]